MKRLPQIDRFFTAVCSFLILATFVLLSSCEKDSLQDDLSRINASNLSKASLVAQINYDEQLNYDDITNCSSACIEEGSKIYYLKSDSKSDESGQSGNTKTISYNAYNTETQFIVEVNFAQNQASSKANITIDIGGDSEQFSNVEDGEMVSHAIELSEGWQGCAPINFSVHASFNQGQGKGNNQNDINFDNVSYSLISVCSSSCDESFSYEYNQEDGSYTFHYVSSEDLENAEVKFTCPHITGFEAMDGKEYHVNPGNSHGSPTVLTWTGNIEACTEITFTLSFDADCGQTHSGKANLFTDFKVNGVSKKGDNENITFDCPK